MKLSIASFITLSLIGAVMAAEPAKVDPAAVVKGNNRFAFELYQRLRHEEGNLFLSPYSISTALAMTSAGARGKTAEQMASVLHFPPQDELHSSLARLMHTINAGGAKKGYQLSTANALWGAKDCPFRPEFLKLAKQYYGADLTNLDFSGDPEGARRIINQWVEKETQDKIKDLIAQGVLQPDTRLVLTNAIYFKGNWDRPFQKERTREQVFRTPNGAKPKAPLMNQTEHYGYTETEELQALELSYTGKELALLVLLPKKDDLAGLEQKLTADLVAGIVGKLRQQTVIATLPKFKTTAQFELAPTLAKMGMSLAFSRDADFSGMTQSQERVAISNVIHKAFVDVNEEGTEAAAATAVVVTRASAIAPAKPIPVLRADHPFVYLIRDVRNGSILFLGRLADPTK
jgi:serine protease inhibitor